MTDFRDELPSEGGTTQSLGAGKNSGTGLWGFNSSPTETPPPFLLITGMIRTGFRQCWNRYVAGKVHGHLNVQACWHDGHKVWHSKGYHCG